MIQKSVQVGGIGRISGEGERYEDMVQYVMQEVFCLHDTEQSIAYAALTGISCTSVAANCVTGTPRSEVVSAYRGGSTPHLRGRLLRVAARAASRRQMENIHY